jgi:hypothetical protein
MKEKEKKKDDRQSSAAWRALNKMVADDIRQGTGDIKPPRVIYAKSEPTTTTVERARHAVLHGEFLKKKGA